MATVGSVLSKEQLLCPICLDLFNQPVSTPCGHNFCRECLQRYWQTSNMPQCPMCKHKLYMRPDLKVNTFISEVASHFKELVEKKNENEKPHHLLDLFCNTDQVYVCQICITKDHTAHQTVRIEDESRNRRAQIGSTKKEVGEMIHRRLQKICDINKIIQISRRNTERETEESLRVFSKLFQLVQRGQAEVAEVIGAKQKQVESMASRLILELEQEIDQLSCRRDELEQLSFTDDDLYLLQYFPAFATVPATKDWSDTCLESTEYVGIVRRKAQRYAVDVHLDPDTAHPKLVLSENKKQVYHGDVSLGLPDNPERFYPCVSVLGKEGFSAGRFYYEVEVKEKTEWDIGVALETVTRKGGNVLNPDRGYWSLGMRKDESYWALSNSPVCVPLIEKPQRIGVYVDMGWGQVSFYNVDSHSHIYSFTGCTFSGRLLPYFNPRRNHICRVILAV
uniref:Zinc finger protein RFP n=1 Tax=Maylandia zebra TaxID=106582 RepID=A0A3P9AWY2_9CICH